MPTSRRAITPRCWRRRAATGWCPTVETMLELREAKLYEHALPELEDELNRCARRADFQPEGELQAPGLLRHRARPALRVVRAAAVRLVPLPGAGGDRRARHLALDRAHPAAQHHPARQRRGRVPARVAAPAHQARMARSQGAHAVAKYDLAVLLRSQREDAAVLAGLDQAYRAHRREAVGRRRADHQAGSSRSSPNTTACSSARPPRSTTTPTVSRAAPGRRACRSSTIRSR